jgi:predicted PurR-regulated permease PerM
MSTIPASRPASLQPAHSRFYIRVFAIAALGLLGWVLFRIFKPFLNPIVWSILLAFLLQPLNHALKHRLRRRDGLAAGLLTAAATLCVVLPAAVLGIVFSGQASQLLARVSAQARRLPIERPSDFFRLPPIASALDWLHAHFSLTSADVEQRMVGVARGLLERIAAQGGALVLGAVGVFLNLVLTLFLLFFFLRDGAATVARLDRAVPLPEERKKALATQLGSVTRAVVLGTLVTALVQGTLVGIAFAVVGFPSPVVFGTLAGALSLLPVGGTALVWLPGAVVLAAQGRWPWAVGLAVYGVVVVSALTSNVLRPRLISGHAEIGTLPVFFGVLGGLAAFGLIGMLLGPVVIALALALLRWAEEGRRAPAH